MNMPKPVITFRVYKSIRPLFIDIGQSEQGSAKHLCLSMSVPKDLWAPETRRDDPGKKVPKDSDVMFNFEVTSMNALRSENR
jgi:hypothetical protein